MSNNLEIDKIIIKPGEKKIWEINVNSRISDSVKIPITTINGKKDGPTLCVTAGVHPTEYSCIEAALQISKEININNLSGKLIILPILNTIGFEAKLPGGVPIDLVDIFAAFPGNNNSSIGHQMAYNIFNKVIKKSDYVIDLHGGELTESKSISLTWFANTNNEEVDNKSKNMAKIFGTKYMLDASTVYLGKDEWKGPTGLLIYEAAKVGIPTIIGESGGGGKMDDESISTLKNGILNVMKELKMIDGEVKTNNPIEINSLTLPIATKTGLFYCYVKAGEEVDNNQLLGEIKNLEGETLEEIKSPMSGIIEITVINPVIKAGDYVLAIVKKSN